MAQTDPISTPPLDTPSPDTEPVAAPVSPTPPKLSRRRTFSFEKADLIKKVIDEYEEDLFDRQEWSERRLQRYAKYRGWLEHKTQPWDGASNAHVPMMMTDCQRTIDTLVNAVLAQRPVMGATAVNQADQSKGETIDELLDYQFFLEQNGEEKVQEWAEHFVVDGTTIAFIPYIKDDRRVADVRTYAALNPSYPPLPQLLQILEDAYPKSFAKQTSDDLWGWSVRWTDDSQQEQVASVEFYTDEDHRLVMVAEREMRVFDGPCFLPKALEDIVIPSRSTNCQIPGPSNPGGADHVTMVDYPSWDEIKRLQQQGYYDQVTPEDLEVVEAHATHGVAVGEDAADPGEHKVQRDALAGQTYGHADTTDRTLTRLTYFGRYDVDDDGLDEDVIFTLLKEPRKLLKVSLLTERYPAIPPRRPFAEARLLPVPGQFYAIGMLELLEHLHDVSKGLLDQTLDKNTLVNTPWFLYRAASGMRPEVIKCAPGEGYPVSNPGQDMVFPQIPNPDQTLSLNLMGMLQAMADKQVVIGDLQFGRVPQGKASALRTVSGMQTVLQQGDARPERLLRRFFAGLAQVFAQFHELNEAFLPPKKSYRVAAMTQPGKNPYRTIDDPSKIRGRFQFDFKANSLNTSKASQAQILQGLMPILFNGMTFQMGLASKETFYTALKKLVTALGQDHNELVIPPSDDSDKEKLTADNVLWLIYSGRMPNGVPQEGPQKQLQIFQDYLLTPESHVLDQGCRVLLSKWMQGLQRQIADQQQMAQQAQQFAQMQSGGGGGGQQPQPQAPGDGMTMPQQGPGQLQDESLPGAGGGANPGPMGMMA